jgi:hypothetical protein
MERIETGWFQANPSLALLFARRLLQQNLPSADICLRKYMKQISQGKQREAKNGTPEVEVMTNAMLIPQCIQGNR